MMSFVFAHYSSANTTFRLFNIRTLNSVGLTSSSLSISKYRSIVALQTALSDRLCDGIEDHGLVASLSTDEIEIEILAIKLSVHH